MSNLENVEMFPEWNKRVSAADRLREIALMADKNPEHFDRLVVGWQGMTEKGQLRVRYSLAGCDTIDLLGLIELVKDELLGVVNGKR